LTNMAKLTYLIATIALIGTLTAFVSFQSNRNLTSKVAP
jgi:hypothetical protein